MTDFTVEFKNTAGDTLYENTFNIHSFLAVGELERQLAVAVYALEREQASYTHEWSEVSINKKVITRHSYDKIKRWQEEGKRREINDYIMGGGIKIDSPNYK